jgi:hypothetical protein
MEHGAVQPRPRCAFLPFFPRSCCMNDAARVQRARSTGPWSTTGPSVTPSLTAAEHRLQDHRWLTAPAMTHHATVITESQAKSLSSAPPRSTYASVSVLCLDNLSNLTCCQGYVNIGDFMSGHWLDLLKINHLVMISHPVLGFRSDVLNNTFGND